CQESTIAIAFTKACFPLQEVVLSKRISLDCFLLFALRVLSRIDKMNWNSNICLQHILYLHLLLSIIKGLFGYGLTLLLLFVIYDNLRHTNGLWKTFGWQACIYHFLFLLGLPYLNGIGGLTGWVSL
ncbi:hypothetical protein ACJX0J_030438, partial [Zea mays]